MKPIEIKLFSFFIFLTGLSVSCKFNSSQSVKALMEEDRINIEVNGELFTSYLFSDKHKYPFFFPVVGPHSGQSLTTMDQEPYPHHSSLYISLDWVISENVERGNYWQPTHELETGQVFSTNPKIIANTRKNVVISDETHWIVPATGTLHFIENRVISVHAPSESIRLIDFEFNFEVQEDLYIRPTGHSFFSARVVPEIAVGCMVHDPDWAQLGTGTIIDSEGNINEKGTREKFSDWAAYYGSLNDITEGLAIIQHPENSYYPAQWVSRDYGFISPSSFTFNNEPVEMKAGQKLFFKYRVVVFSGSPEEADISGWQKDYINR